MSEPDFSGARPRWRWWLFCLALWLYARVDWDWPLELLGWSVLPEWLAREEELAAIAAGGDSEVPF